MREWQPSMGLVESRCSMRAQAGEIRAGTAERYAQIFNGFWRYAVASDVFAPRDVTAELCERFLAAPTGGRYPLASTRAVRLAALRDAFDGFVETGLAVENPTANLRVSRGTALAKPCPLTPEEAVRLRLAGKLSSNDTLRPAAVALAIAGASHPEIANAVVADINLAAALVRLGSGPREREISVDDKALTALSARIAAQRRHWRHSRKPWDPMQVPLAMHRAGESYRAASVAPTVSMNLRRALDCAGVRRPGVRPQSLREYAANAVYAKTGRVEDVAAHLGIASLDSAQRLVDWEWQRRWVQVVVEGDSG